MKKNKKAPAEAEAEIHVKEVKQLVFCVLDYFHIGISFKEH